MKKKLIVVICFAFIVALLATAYALAKPYFAEDESGTVSKSEYDEDGDRLGTSSRPFMYPNISRSDVDSITVTNEHGTYKAYRINSSFYFEGAEELAYDKEMFSSLVVNATYTLATRKIKFDTYNYEDFGLTADTCTATIEVNTLDEKYHKIIIGNKLANGGGYYAKYDGKDYIYVLDSTLEDAVLCSLNDYLTPWLVYPIETTDYLSLSSFYYYRNGEPFFAARNSTADEQKETGNYYVTVFPKETNYVVSSYYYGTVLQSLTQLQGKSVLEYGLYPPVEPTLDERGEDETDEEYAGRVAEYEIKKAEYETANAEYEAKLAEYGIGIDGQGHTVLYVYDYPITDDNGEKTGNTVAVNFTLDISEKTEDDTYFVYSMYFGVIAEVPYSTLYWLEWDISRFLEYSMFSMNINEVNSIKAVFDGNEYIYTLKRDSDGNASQVFAGKNEYDMDTFRQFYITLLEFKIYGRTEKPVWDEPVLTITLDTEQGEYEYVFYMKTTRKVYYTCNGEGEFYVNVDKVWQFKREAIAIYNGELIQ